MKLNIFIPFTEWPSSGSNGKVPKIRGMGNSGWMRGKILIRNLRAAGPMFSKSAISFSRNEPLSVPGIMHHHVPGRIKGGPVCQWVLPAEKPADFRTQRVLILRHKFLPLCGTFLWELLSVTRHREEIGARWNTMANACGWFDNSWVDKKFNPVRTRDFSAQNKQRTLTQII